MKLPKEIHMNYDDYCKLPYDGKRYEIIEGELFNAPAPFTIHQAVSRNLELILANFLRRTGLGVVFYAPTDVVLSDEDIVQPDIIYIGKERMNIITERNTRGAPDLVIEILSPGREDFDRSIKRKLYSKYKINEYWIVDPMSKTIEKLCFKGRVYHAEKKYTGDDFMESDILLGLRIELNEVFE